MIIYKTVVLVFLTKYFSLNYCPFQYFLYFIFLFSFIIVGYSEYFTKYFHYQIPVTLDKYSFFGFLKYIQMRWFSAHHHGRLVFFFFYLFYLYFGWWLTNKHTSEKKLLLFNVSFCCVSCVSFTGAILARAKIKRWWLIILYLFPFWYKTFFSSLKTCAFD